jgi:hypothetical protein
MSAQFIGILRMSRVLVADGNDERAFPIRPFTYYVAPVDGVPVVAQLFVKLLN